MKADVKEKWVAALRSGNYQQGMRKLRGSHTFCCLGVLCDIAAREGVVEALQSESTSIYRYQAPDGEWSQTSLPNAVMDWAGLQSNDPLVVAEGCGVRLSELNDGGSPFEKIASLIEEHL